MENENKMHIKVISKKYLEAQKTNWEHSKFLNILLFEETYRITFENSSKKQVLRDQVLENRKNGENTYLTYSKNWVNLFKNLIHGTYCINL